MVYSSPKEIVKTLDEIGKAKCLLPIHKMLVLALLAGVYIGFGGTLYIIVTHDLSNYVGLGMSKLIGGVVFSIGLILVILGGVELFTGNNLLIVSCMDEQISLINLAKNWIFVYGGNFLGSIMLVVLFIGTGLWKTNNFSIGANALILADSKVNMSFLEAFCRGILCNWLVCLAVWLSTSTKSLVGKILSIIFPITAFVACGFEHSVANMFFIPLGILLKNKEILITVTGTINLSNLTWGSLFINNLLPVTLGNIVGGTVFVGFLYWFVYHKPSQKTKKETIIKEKIRAHTD